MASDKSFDENCTPLGFFESYKNNAVTDKQRALYEHSVTRKKREHFVLGHSGKLVFEVEGFIEQTACIEEFF